MNVVTVVLASTLLLPAQFESEFDPTNETGQTAVVPYCIVSLIDEAEVPAKEAGVLAELDVREGMQVKKDALLGQIDDRDVRVRREIAQFQYRIAEKEAGNVIRIVAARASAEAADAELELNEEVERKSPGSIPKPELMRLALNAKHAHLQIDLAKHELEVAGITMQSRGSEIAAADNDIERRRVEAPLDGVVVQVFIHRGEWVNPGDPICRIVRVDKLRVEGFVDADKFTPDEVANRPVTVTVQTKGGAPEEFHSRIGFVSPVIEAGGEYRVWTEVENRAKNGFWVLRPGLNAVMEIELDDSQDVSLLPKKISGQ